MLLTGAAGPSGYWYLTRGTGIVSLVLLTVTVALGVANVRRLRTENVPRFVVDAVHRNVALLAVAFLAIHVITAVLDSFAHISLINAFVPFTGSYRPLWLGLGTVSLDLLLAVVITSLLRRSFGHRAWRVTHWAAYVSWPVALLHSLGTGTDTKTGWMLTVVGGCVIVMIVAVVARAVSGWPHHAGARLTALIASALVPLGLLVWLPSGPLAAGWAKKAGTPATLLSAASSSSTASNSSQSSTSSSAATSFTANTSGTVSQSQLSDGTVAVNISLSLSGERLNTLAIHLRGQPIDGGGIQMNSSAVTLGPRSNPAQYRGQVTSLDGTNIVAQLSDGSGKQMSVVARLQLSPDGGSASGTVSAKS